VGVWWGNRLRQTRYTFLNFLWRRAVIPQTQKLDLRTLKTWLRPSSPRQIKRGVRNVTQQNRSDCIETEEIRMQTGRRGRSARYGTTTYTAVLFCSVLFFSRPRAEGWPHHGRTFSPFIPVILTDSSTEIPVHVLMLSIQAVRGLPRLRAPGIENLYFTRMNISGSKGNRKIIN